MSDQSARASTAARSQPLLAIDSSTEQAGVGLYDGVRLGEIVWAAGRTQTATLLSQVHHLLTLHGVSASDLGAVAVTTGPGTFNGLRVGMAVAKGLMLGLDLPLLGVSTLAAAAMPHADMGRTVVAIVAAGRGRLVWAEYGDDQAGWSAVVPPRNGMVRELASQLAGLQQPIVTGELTPEEEAIVDAVPGVTLAPRSLRGRRPAAVISLAWDRYQAGEADDAARLEPLYLGR